MITVWSMLDAYFNEHKPKSRFRIIKPSMYKSGPGGYPKLKGKASEVKNLTPALLSVWNAGMNEHDEKHVAVRTALETSIRLDQMLEDCQLMSPMSSLRPHCGIFKVRIC